MKPERGRFVAAARASLASLARPAFDGGPAVLQIHNTMLRSFRLGTLAGFPVSVNLSFLIMLGVVAVWFGGMQGVAVLLIAAGSVLLHELGHALMARHLGVPVVGIELHFFGGAAQMSDLPRSPDDEIAVAVAGPAVSFALAGIGHGLAGITGLPALALFGWVNLMLAVFNLLPAFPSDGGRILRAWLARRRGLVSATELAVKVGRVVCVALVVLGLVVGSLQLVLVATVLWLMGSAERLGARLRGDRGDWRGRDAERISPLHDSPGTYRRPTPPDVEYVPPDARRPRTGLPPRVVIWRL
jgi:Zn-dependent protease